MLDLRLPPSTRTWNFASLPSGSEREIVPQSLAVFGVSASSMPPRRSGCEGGPGAIRAASIEILKPYLESPTRTAVDMESGLRTRLRERPCGIDLGNLDCFGQADERALEAIANLVAALTGGGAFPVMLGGAACLASGFAQGFQRAGLEPQWLVVSPSLELPLIMDVTSCALPDVGGLRTAPIVCIGTNGLVSARAWKAVEASGGALVTAESVHTAGAIAACSTAFERLSGARPIVCIIDMAVIDTGYAAGCPDLNVGGLEPQQLFEIARAITRRHALAGLAITNVAPALDARGHTETIAAAVAWETLRTYLVEEVGA